jgi:predicted aconitase with swiveling domain
VFGVTNPVMVQGAVLAGIPITEGWSPEPGSVLRTGDWVRLDPGRRVVELLRRGA